jgi:hypothetical protein
MRIVRLTIVATTLLVVATAYIGVKYFMTSEGVAAPQSLTYRLDIKGQEGSDPPILQARQGDRIALIVTSPNPGEIFIHGLDKHAMLTPRSEATVAFTAERSGRYYIHFHGMDHSHTEVAVMEVSPR